MRRFPLRPATDAGGSWHLGLTVPPPGAQVGGGGGAGGPLELRFSHCVNQIPDADSYLFLFWIAGYTAGEIMWSMTGGANAFVVGAPDALALPVLGVCTAGDDFVVSVTVDGDTVGTIDSSTLLRACLMIGGP